MSTDTQPTPLDAARAEVAAWDDTPYMRSLSVFARSEKHWKSIAALRELIAYVERAEARAEAAEATLAEVRVLAEQQSEPDPYEPVLGWFARRVLAILDAHPTPPAPRAVTDEMVDAAVEAHGRGMRAALEAALGEGSTT